MRTLLFALCATIAPLPAIAAGAPPAASAGQGIQPHRAVYDIGLARTDEGSGVSSAKGRMVFEIVGSACDGYTMRQRMVVNLGDEEGGQGLLDFQIATFETSDGQRYTFDSRTSFNGNQIESVEGEAHRSGSRIEVKLTEPVVKTVRLDGDTLFPNQHLQRIIEAAIADRKFVAAEIYEGSGDGEGSDAAAAAIGGSTDEGPGGLLREGVRHWPISVGYFGGPEKPADGLGEEIPYLQLQFTLYENGVTNDLVLDYGDYALSGALKEIEKLEPTECPSR